MSTLLLPAIYNGKQYIYKSILVFDWLNIKSKIDSTLRVKLTQHWESNWLNIETFESQIDLTLRV